MGDPTIKAVFFDFGGVVLSSPFDAFNEYEARNGLPRDLLRSVNSTNPDRNAWAQFERSEVSFDVFCGLFESECRELGHAVDARVVMSMMAGTVRPQMVEAIRRCRDRFVVACLTNNFVSSARPPARANRADVAEVLALFHHVVESSRVGVRKPDPRFYEIACELAGVCPDEVVFLDDLGTNLKPAKALGMTTIKVGDPDEAIRTLQEVVGFRLAGLPATAD